MGGCVSRERDPRLVLKEHSRAVTSLVWLDDSRLASGSLDGDVCIWLVPSVQDDRSVLRGQTSQCLQRKLRPDGPSPPGVLALARIDMAAVDCYPLVKGKLQLTASSWGLASGDKGGTLRLWNVDNGSHWALNGHSGELTALAGLGRDSVASGGADRTVRLWGVDSDGAAYGVLRGHSSGVSAIRTTGPLLVSASRYELRVWRDEECIHQLNLRPEGWHRSPGLGADAVCAGVDRRVSVLERSDRWQIHGGGVPSQAEGIATVLSVCGAGGKLVAVGSGSSLAVICPKTGTVLAEQSAWGSDISALEQLDENTLLVGLAASESSADALQLVAASTLLVTRVVEHPSMTSLQSSSVGAMACKFGGMVATSRVRSWSIHGNIRDSAAIYVWDLGGL